MSEIVFKAVKQYRDYIIIIGSLLVSVLMMAAIQGCSTVPSSPESATQKEAYPTVLHQYCGEADPHRRAVARLAVNAALIANNLPAMTTDICRVVANLGDGYQLGDLTLAYCQSTDPAERLIIAKLLGAKVVDGHALSDQVCQGL